MAQIAHLCTPYVERIIPSPLLVCPVTLKLEVCQVKCDITHSHDIPLGHNDTHVIPFDSLHPSKPTVTANVNVPIQYSLQLYLPSMGELHCKYCHVSPYDKDSMGNTELPCDHFWERTHRTHNPGIPQTQDALQPLPQSSHILEPKDTASKDFQSLCPHDSVNDTEFEDSLHEFTVS